MGHITDLFAVCILVGLSMEKEMGASQDTRRIGCYEYREGRAWPYRGPSYGDVEPCIKHCMSDFFLFAGVQEGWACFCGNGGYDVHGESDMCTFRCERNSDLTCGGWRAIEVFKAECKPGSFGAWCVSECHCDGGVPCDPFSGQCPNNSCASGWKGNSCSIECYHTQYGPSCKGLCHCDGGTSCDSITGRCPNDKCAPGWKGESCEIHDENFPSDMKLVIGLSITVGLLTTALPIAIILAYSRDKRYGLQESESYTTKSNPPQVLTDRSIAANPCE